VLELASSVQRTAVEFVFTRGAVLVSVTQPRSLQALSIATLVLSRRTFWQNTERLYTCYSAPRIASAVLAIPIPTVRLSVTRRYCVKTTARSTVQFAPLDSKMCLVL